jgi:hypothetical protein
MPGFQLAIHVLAFVSFVCSVDKPRFCPAFIPGFTAPRRRANAVACVPTFESSLTPAGAAAVDRARALLDLYVLIAVERAALLVLPARLNRRLVHACMHA